MRKPEGGHVKVRSRPQRQHVTLPTGFRSPFENSHSRYGYLTARFAPDRSSSTGPRNDCRGVGFGHSIWRWRAKILRKKARPVIRFIKFSEAEAMPSHSVSVHQIERRSSPFLQPMSPAIRALLEPTRKERMPS